MQPQKLPSSTKYLAIIPVIVFLILSITLNISYILNIFAQKTPFFHCASNDTIFYCLNEDFALFNPIAISRKELCQIKNFFNSSKLKNDIPFYSTHFSAKYNYGKFYSCELYKQHKSPMYSIDCNLIKNLSFYLCPFEEI